MFNVFQKTLAISKILKISTGWQGFDDRKWFGAGNDTDTEENFCLFIFIGSAEPTEMCAVILKSVTRLNYCSTVRITK